MQYVLGLCLARRGVCMIPCAWHVCCGADGCAIWQRVRACSVPPRLACSRTDSYTIRSMAQHASEASVVGPCIRRSTRSLNYTKLWAYFPCICGLVCCILYS
eukprot:3315078-Pleurochrysis_carterae.AAC.1